MTTEELKKEIEDNIDIKPKNWRKGQFVFNYINSTYSGVSREVQFNDGVDCFHNDEQIDNFINHCVKRINEYERRNK